MRIRSYEDILNWVAHLRKWIRSPWFKASVILAVLSYLLWHAVLWALTPGLGGVNGIVDPNASALAIAKDRFGPIWKAPQHLPTLVGTTLRCVPNIPASAGEAMRADRISKGSEVV